MSTSAFARWGAIAALAAGAAWIALSLDSILRPHPERYRDALFVVPFALSLLSVIGVHALQRERAGRLGRLGFWATVATMLAALVGQIAIVAQISALEWLAFPVGLLGWTAGMALFGIATARAGVLPRWCGAALALSEPLAVVAGLALSPIVPLSESGSYSGAIAHGVVWLAVGSVLRSRQGLPSRGRSGQPTAPSVA